MSNSLGEATGFTEVQITQAVEENLLFKRYKTCSVFLMSFRNTSGRLGEQEMLWKHKPQASVSRYCTKEHSRTLMTFFVFLNVTLFLF